LGQTLFNEWSNDNSENDETIYSSLFGCTGILSGQADLLLLLRLSGGDVFGLRALGAIGYFHGYSLPLLEGLVTFRLDRAVMNENVFSTLL